MVRENIHEKYMTHVLQYLPVVTTVTVATADAVVLVDAVVVMVVVVVVVLVCESGCGPL